MLNQQTTQGPPRSDAPFVPRLGAIVANDGVTFRVWAAAHSEVFVVTADGAELPLDREDEGYFAGRSVALRPGARYWYRAGGELRPDPASRFQPDGPLGPSEIVDPRAFRWSDDQWPGAPERHRHVCYELHVGTFTPEGTWAAAISQLPWLAELGVTTLEVMPIAEFAGWFGWGYDGVDLFAPTRLYGRPDDVRRFVDAAHARGLAVILDVVYNHLGPVGNFLSQFSPTYFGPPGAWGDSINYDGPGSDGVRAFVTENAAYWIHEYHFDGLRLDATHGIHDTSPDHIVTGICRSARVAAGSRRVFIVGESETQDTRLLAPVDGSRDGLDALWNEDWHHSAFVTLTGRRLAYFTDYTGEASEFAAMARHNLLYQGQWYSWQTMRRGGWAFGLPGSAFVNFLENHDQIANTGLGTRLFQYVDRGKWRALTTLLLLGPAVPLLFQGQEWASSRPFTYFADHEGELGDAVRNGRLAFLAQFPGLATEAMQRLFPDPRDGQAFARCALDHAERESHLWAVALHRDLLALRRDDPVISQAGSQAVHIESSAPASQVVLVRYFAEAGHRLLLVNLSTDYLSPMNDPLFAAPPGEQWIVAWSSEDARYGGAGSLPFIESGRWLLRGASATLLTSHPAA